jgi:hypothetical protein
MKLNEFILGYITCALWSSTGMDDDCEHLDEKYDSDDLAPETRKAMEADCEKFIAENEAVLGDYEEIIGTHPEYSESEKAGHDFWLTRNGHGAGFWDRGIGETGETLTEASTSFGGVDLYAGDDGKLYT